MPIEPMPSGIKVDATISSQRLLLPLWGAYSRTQLAIGVLGTILIHAFVVFLIWGGALNSDLDTVEYSYNEYIVELVEEISIDDPENLAVRTNPDVAEEPPEETKNLGAQDQKSASSLPPVLEDHEKVLNPEGSLKNAVTEAQSELNPSRNTPPRSDGPQVNRSVRNRQSPSATLATPRSPMDRLWQGRKSVGLAEQSRSALADKYLIHLSEVEEASITEENSLAQGLEANDELSDLIEGQRERPQVLEILKEPVVQSLAASKNEGETAVSANSSIWENFKIQLYRDVERTWDLLCEREGFEQEGARVRLRFIISEDGTVRDIEVLDETTANDRGIELCREAIELSMPFQRWSQALVDSIGGEKQVEFVFAYF